MEVKTLKQLQNEIAMGHPANVYPGMIGAVGFGYYFLFESLLMVGVASGALLAVSVGAFVVNKFVRSDAFMNEAMELLNTDRERLRVRQLGELSSKLESDLTRSQLARIQDKFQTFKDVLSERFTHGTITYNRFLGTAEEIFLLSIKRISEIHLKEKQLNGIDESFCIKRIADLELADSSDLMAQQEIASLKSRLKIKKNTEETISQILVSNEEAVTTFDVVMDQMSDSNCKSENDLSFLMKELESVSKIISDD